MPLRPKDSLIKIFLASSSSSLSVLFSHISFFSPLLSNNLSQSSFHMSPYPFVCHPPSRTCGHFVSFCAILVPFSPHVSPFHNNQTLSRFSRIPWATPAFSPSFSICLSPSSFFALPLCAAHLQHIKIPLFFLQRIVQSLGDLLHSSMFSLHIFLPVSSAWQHYTVFNSLSRLLCLFNTFVSILSFCVFLFSVLLE